MLCLDCIGRSIGLFVCGFVFFRRKVMSKFWPRIKTMV